MIKIYHNPRCKKSREGLEILEKSGQNFEIINYLVDIPTTTELKKVIQLLGIAPEQLIRKNEPIWKAQFRGKSLSEDELIVAMASHPKLIERPIVIKGNKAVIGRPPTKIMDIL